MNPLVATNAVPALLALEDGSFYEGLSCGAAGETFGELVFNTSMSGYQEVITDPSYAGQVVTFTYPQIGNYGICAAVNQSSGISLAGIVVCDMCHTPSNWQSEQSLPDYLKANDIVAIECIDTRQLTLKIREAGTMRCAISTTDLDPESLIKKVQASPSISETNWVAEVSTPTSYEALSTNAERDPKRVVALDCGEKQGILQGLQAVGCNVTVMPWDTTPEDILALNPDGVFLSNGPGDPRELPVPTATAAALLGKVPVFGICLGHQMICAATGAELEKLPYGHHGGNQPVMNLLSGMVEVTAQNHNYGLVWPSLGELVVEECGGTEVVAAWEASDEAKAGDLRFWSERRIAPVINTEKFGRVRLTHVNLNDGTPEGMQFLDIPAFSVQYHPEASPGPHDAVYLFEAFRRLMDGEPNYLDIDVREGRRF